MGFNQAAKDRIMPSSTDTHCQQCQYCEKLATALHRTLNDLAAKIVKAWEDGHRSSDVDIYDLQETLLELADSIPAPE